MRRGLYSYTLIDRSSGEVFFEQLRTEGDVLNSNIAFRVLGYQFRWVLTSTLITDSSIEKYSDYVI